MKKLIAFCIMAAAVLVLPVGAVQASLTVATFGDPSGNSANPLFTVDWTNKTVTGGWADSKSGLNLFIPLTGVTFANAWFEMDTLAITTTNVFGGSKYGETGQGHIRFYADGTSTSPVLCIDFENGTVGKQGLAASDDTDDLFSANNVTITGSAIPFALSEEQFSFSFANVAKFPNPNASGGFTSTASFTSSAIPEPATMSLLVLGGLSLLRRKV
jgi:hypothetical protein